MHRFSGKHLIILAVLSLLPSAVLARIPQMNVDSHEWIRSWLMCGPMDNPLPPEIKEYQFYTTLLGFNIDYLSATGGETGTVPEEGLSFTAADGKQHEWKLYQAPETGLMDLKSMFEKNTLAVTYAACDLTSDADKEVWLGVGSDDGVKVWLNGKLVWWNHYARGVKPDQDLVRLDVKKGSNLLLLKVDQGEGNWGFCARTVDKAAMAREVKSRTPQKEEPMDLIVEKSGEGLEVMMGRTSPLRILGVPCIVTMRDASGKTVQFNGGPLGEPISLSCAGLKPGPYWLDCTVESVPAPNYFTYHPFAGRILAPDPGQGIFYHHGPSSVLLKNYGRDGKPSDASLAMLGPSFAEVKKAFKDDVGPDPEDAEPGTTRLLRTDITPFRLQVMLDSASLGRRWLLVDNEGRGYTAPNTGQMTLNLPLEAARSMRARIQRTLKENGSLPGWLRKDLERRVRDTAELSSENLDHKQVYAMLDRLIEVKNRLPSDGPISMWCALSTDKTSKTEPVPEYELDAAHVALARNEYEPFQIVLRSEEALSGLTVEFETPKSSSGAAIDIGDLDVKLVEYVNLEASTEDTILRHYPSAPIVCSFGTAGPWPDPLPPIREPFALKPGENQPLWITVHAPEGQKPGVYRGALKIMCGKNLVARAPFEVEVFDFALPEKPSTPTALGVCTEFQGGTKGPYHGPLNAEQIDQVYDLYMRLFSSHRMSPLFMPISASVQTTFEGNPPRAKLDFTSFDKTISSYVDKYGFTTFFFNTIYFDAIPKTLAGFPICSPEYNRLFREKWFAVQEHLREKGWLDKAYFYSTDEPTPANYPSVKQKLELLKWACPDIRRMLTTHMDPTPVPYFYGLVDLWCPVMHSDGGDMPNGDIHGYNAELAHARQALGEEVWWYTCNVPFAPYANYFIDNPGINHRVQFWLMDRFDVEGFLYFDTTYWLHNPWEHAMVEYPDGGPVFGNGAGVFLYPPRRDIPKTALLEPPVTSIRFEEVRDGLEDLEYLALLKKAAEAGNRSGPVAQGLLDSFHGELAPSLTCYEQNAVLLEAARYAVAEAVESEGRNEH